ncbi:Ribosomal protein lysine methyltransferase [Collariella sp. IMI 366227]|nr:Ribosomal protein lysine methyltransferase [Collariella sp. IMI 366227]
MVPCAKSPLFSHGVLAGSSLVLELGCGISGLVALLLAPRIARYVLTDPYVAKLVEQNVSENHQPQQSHQRAGSARAKTSRSSRSRGATPTPSGARKSPEMANSPRDRDRTAIGIGPAGSRRIHFTPLDWETDEVMPALTGTAEASSFDAVVACDCIYNEALIDPFVSTCADLCKLRLRDEAEEGEAKPCVCVVAQQLRDPLVFEAWLLRFSRSFHTWRVPDEMLVQGLRSDSGFVVHVGVLKEAIKFDEL